MGYIDWNAFMRRPEKRFDNARNKQMQHCVAPAIGATVHSYHYQVVTPV